MMAHHVVAPARAAQARHAALAHDEGGAWLHARGDLEIHIAINSGHLHVCRRSAQQLQGWAHEGGRLRQEQATV